MNNALIYRQPLLTVVLLDQILSGDVRAQADVVVFWDAQPVSQQIFNSSISGPQRVVEQRPLVEKVVDVGRQTSAFLTESRKQLVKLKSNF